MQNFLSVEKFPEKAFITFKFGLSDSTKELMKARDLTRNKIKSSSVKEEQILLAKYKALRNKVSQQLWLKHSILTNFADDTTTYTKSKEARQINSILAKEKNKRLIHSFIH